MNDAPSKSSSALAVSTCSPSRFTSIDAVLLSVFAQSMVHPRPGRVSERETSYAVPAASGPSFETTIVKPAVSPAMIVASTGDFTTVTSAHSTVIDTSSLVTLIPPSAVTVAMFVIPSQSAAVVGLTSVIVKSAPLARGPIDSGFRLVTVISPLTATCHVGSIRMSVRVTPTAST